MPKGISINVSNVRGDHSHRCLHLQWSHMSFTLQGVKQGCVWMLQSLLEDIPVTQTHWDECRLGYSEDRILFTLSL